MDVYKEKNLLRKQIDKLILEVKQDKLDKIDTLKLRFLFEDRFKCSWKVATERLKLHSIIDPNIDYDHPAGQLNYIEDKNKAQEEKFNSYRDVQQ